MSRTKMAFREGRKMSRKRLKRDLKASKSLDRAASSVVRKGGTNLIKHGIKNKNRKTVAKGVKLLKASVGIKVKGSAIRTAARAGGAYKMTAARKAALIKAVKASASKRRGRKRT